VAELDVAMTARLEVRINKQYALRHQSFILDVQFAVEEEIVVIFGPSGAGKTTILECIAGLTEPVSGNIILHGKVLFDAAARTNVSLCERRIGYVFQSLALFPHLSAKQNIAYGLQSLSEVEREGQISEVLQAFHISHVAHRKPAAMSGGEQQRVALARSLVTQPLLLLLDEPMSALDDLTKAAIISDLRTWHAQHRIPIIYVTHSIDEVFAIGNRVLRLAGGKIIQQGTPAEVLNEERKRLLISLQPGGD
jgi:molybdate transport system ATP-binding protein